MKRSAETLHCLAYFILQKGKNFNTHIPPPHEQALLDEDKLGGGGGGGSFSFLLFPEIFLLLLFPEIAVTVTQNKNNEIFVKYQNSIWLG